jgi:hypothetical protein
LPWLPHLSAIPGNLAVIREKGVAAWLVEQERHWKCPSCQTAFSWYDPECATCGRGLDDLKGFRSRTAKPARS